MIPQIIHHIAPDNQDSWHFLWKPCYKSWLSVYKDKFILKLWNDTFDLKNLIKNNFPEYLPFFNSLPYHIQKIDFCRLAILYKYGGIYADMDVYCYKNFYFELKSHFCIIEAPYSDVPVENALMCSVPQNLFLRKCMDNAVMYMQSHDKEQLKNIVWDSVEFRELILNTAGPSAMWKEVSQNNVQILPGKLFNPHGLSYSDEIYTKHLLSGIWGAETTAKLKKMYKKRRSMYKNFDDFSKDVYKNSLKKIGFHNVDMDIFDFKTNYTK
jgi:mannosyltransferase OCH1-like enzyme